MGGGPCWSREVSRDVLGEAESRPCLWGLGSEICQADTLSPVGLPYALFQGLCCSGLGSHLQPHLRSPHRLALRSSLPEPQVAFASATKSKRVSILYSGALWGERKEKRIVRAC